MLNSRFSLRDEEGPPANRNGLNRYAPCYIFKFKNPEYKREIIFSPHGDYVSIRDYYGDYQLPSIQMRSMRNFLDYRRQYALNDSWKKDLSQQLGKGGTGDGKGAVQIDIPWEPPKMVTKFIGEGKSNIKVTGSRSITFSGRSEWEDGLKNTGTFKQSRFPTLQMEQKSRFKVTGSIGSKITVEVDQDSQRDTELANTIKLRYKGEEDEILQSIEAGNTNLALPNAQLIGYSQNVQGLFGIKATAKIGKLDLTMITSQEKGTSEKTTFNAGAKGSEQKIRDYQYLANTYFWLGPHESATDRVVSMELYVNGQVGVHTYGWASVNPDSVNPNITQPERDRTEWALLPFKRLDYDDYVVYKQNWYIVLNQPVDQGATLAAFIKYAHYPNYPDTSIADTIRIGMLGRDTTGTDTSLVLRMLKAKNPDTSFTTWDLMWRNVYDLGSRNISSDGFDLKIYRGNGTPESDPEDLNGQCFITILGLDHLNNNSNTEGADCLFDFNNTTVDAARGHLIFPTAQPFISPSLDEKVPEIYRLNPGSSQQQFINATKYYIWVKSAQRASTFALGRANIMQGSEVVKMGDGTVLKRGVDYEINYDIGQITFLNQQALNPAANVTVDFEYAPFFMPEKKSLFGVAGQYQLWDNSNISLAAMYRSEAASDPRPRVGREPRRGFIWDSNFQFGFKPEFMTSLVDALPLVETDAPSTIDISGEIAQSFPNPNTKNQAFIDDFEGSRNYTDLSSRRATWTKSSPPLDSALAPMPLARRSAIWWYNPWNTLTIRDIWPDREVKNTENRQDVLFLHFHPDTISTSPESSWAGVMRPFYAGLADQSLTKFIEVWYRPDPYNTTDSIALHLDFGLISEDINDDQAQNSEDRANSGARNTFEPDEEDTGLDGKFDASEPGYDPNNNPDPNGDDWSYENESDDYSRINGTENNREDPDRRGRFDTEDINNDGSFNMQNGYFEYTVHLNNPEYMVDSTDTGWKLLRIPFQDSSVYRVRGNPGSADFTRIGYARIWFTGARHAYLLGIASFELVGNKWQELPIAFPEGDTTRPEEKFEVTVKNTQENAGYYPPPGVAGQLDRRTGIREKEQSLVLVYENMAAGHVGGAYWNLYQSEDYTQYQHLKMYVHGDLTPESGVPEGQATFFFRLSQDGRNFYEYHSTLDSGWTDNNAVDIDFAVMTNLKYELQKRVPPESLATADTTDGHYRVYGNPSLSQIKMFIVGVEINGQAPALYTGEIWLDELRVTDIRKQSDFAGRIQATARFADFFDVNLSYSRTGANFMPLSARIPQGSTSISRSVRFNMRVDKMFPPSLGLNLPASVSWQNTLQLPRLKTGSDIILDPTAREFEKTENKATSYTFSQSFNKNTKNWLWNLTLNRIKTSYTFARNDGISPTNPINRRDTYKGTGSYDLTPKSKPSLKPFFWAKYLFVPKKIYESPMYYLPAQLSFSGEVNSSRSVAVNQRGIRTSSYIRDLLLSGTTGFNIFSSLRTSYNMVSSRDISQPGRFNLSLNPSRLKLGREQTFQQRFETSFQPKILQAVENRFSFNSNYSENSDLKKIPDSTRTTQMGGSFKTDLTINLQNLLGKGGGGNRPRSKENNPPPIKDGDINRLQGEGGPEGKEDNQEQTKKGDEENVRQNGKSPPKWLLGQFGSLFKSLKPIQASYLKDKKLTVQGLLERPSWQYIFGLSDRPRARSKSTNGLVTPNQTVYSNSYTLDSGLQPGHGLDINAGYSLRNTTTRSSNDPVKAKSVTFPDVTASLSGLEKMFIFKKYSSTVSLQTGYSRKVDENGRADTGELYKRDTSKLWAPLASLTVNFKNNVKATLRYDMARNISENLRQTGEAQRNVFGYENTFKVSLSYSLTAPKGLKLPLLKRVKFNSQLSLMLDVTVKSSRAESFTGPTKSIDSNKKQMIIEPKFTYQFSKAITGSMHARWDDSNDKIQKRKRHVRELGISAEIRF